MAQTPFQKANRVFKARTWLPRGGRGLPTGGGACPAPRTLAQRRGWRTTGLFQGFCGAAFAAGRKGSLSEAGEEADFRGWRGRAGSGQALRTVGKRANVPIPLAPAVVRSSRAMWRHTHLSPETRAHLDKLRRHVEGVMTPFVTSGEVALPQGVTLRFDDGAAVTLHPGDARAPAALRARCQPASFGHGRATRVDPRVRKALQRNARGAFVVEGFDPASVLDAVRRDLCPHDPNPLRAELYAVNVYGPGDHFVTHKDTPRGDDMIGTLVLCATRSFCGGEMTFTRGGARRRVACAAGLRGVVVKEAVWLAFFGDVDHAVETVRGGDRVTLTWLLRRSEGAPRAAARRQRLTEGLSAALRRALCDELFATHRFTLAVPCTHLYAGVPGFVKAAPAIDARTVLRLKGRDQEVAAALLDVGLDVTFQRYLIDQGCDQYWPLARLPTPTERAVFHNDRISGSQIEHKLPVEGTPDQVDVQWLTNPVEGYERPADPKAATEFLGAAEYSETGYFGNEGSDAEFYLHAALRVDFPAMDTPRRKRLIAAARRATESAEAPKKVKAAKAKAVRPASPPADAKREYMASELRALGHTPAAVKKMLADGTLERCSYGWYRFTRGS